MADPANIQERPRYSVVIPVYRNEATLSSVVQRLDALAQELDGPLEAVFVVDGSPDGSLGLLRALLSETRAFSSQLIALSRNFGVLNASKYGLAAAEGSYISVMAADLQEPVSLIRDFFEALASGQYDVAVGVRTSRSDPPITRLTALLFWGFYRRFVQKEIPPGGVDIWSCTRQVADQLIQLEESHSSPIGLLYWVGFRRKEIPYERHPRAAGRSAWSFRRKVRYLLDSIFSFTDLPVMVITTVGAVGVVVSFGLGVSVFVGWLTGNVHVRGYTPLMLVLVFIGSSVLLSLGVIGSYVWRTYENTKGRPGAIPMTRERFRPGSGIGDHEIVGLRSADSLSSEPARKGGFEL
jgi:glycosyltransferase involved in cell wall biosynthesis